ncbi:MAG: hypothetical protein ACU85V_19485 [Gammaproteobacteria bacterium]
MRALADISARLDEPGVPAAELLSLAEDILAHWVAAHGREPTTGEREGFRLLALHRQGAAGEPSFNACRETCRELAYHYNLICAEPDADDGGQRLEMMRYVARHLHLFVSGKLEQSALGDFCCSSRPLRAGEASPDHAAGPT